MDKIQRLIVKAQGRYPSKRAHIAWISIVDGKVEASVDLWDGVKGSFNPEADRITGYYRTVAEAMEEVERIAEKYKTKMDDLPVFIDDMYTILYGEGENDAKRLIEAMATEELRTAIDFSGTDEEFRAFFVEMAKKYTPDIVGRMSEEMFPEGVREQILLMH